MPQHMAAKNIHKVFLYMKPYFMKLASKHISLGIKIADKNPSRSIGL